MSNPTEVPESVPEATLVPVTASRGFEEAAWATLGFLAHYLPLGLWVVTRKSGRSWIVLQVEDRAYNIARGSVLHWDDTICERMVDGRGPNIAPHVDHVAAYRDAPMCQVMPIGTYVGVPLLLGDGAVFGTLCGLDPNPSSEVIEHHLPLLRLLAEHLGTIASFQIARDEQDRSRSRARAPGETDTLTGLLNPTGWARYAARAEEHCRSLGSPCAAICLELPGLVALRASRTALADDLLHRAAQVLTAATRASDAAARLDGDELGVLIVGSPEPGVRSVAERISAMFARAGIDVMMSVRMRRVGSSVDDAIRGADAALHSPRTGASLHGGPRGSMFGGTRT